MGRIQVFSRAGGGGVNGRGPPPMYGVRGHPPPENFEISSPRKRNFRHTEAKSVCFDISLF